MFSKQRTAEQYRTILLVRFFLWLTLVAVAVAIVVSGYFEGDPHGYILVAFIIAATFVTFLVALNLMVWTVIAFRSIRWPLRVLGLGPPALYLALILWLITLEIFQM